MPSLLLSYFSLVGLMLLGFSLAFSPADHALLQVLSCLSGQSHPYPVPEKLGFSPKAPPQHPSWDCPRPWFLFPPVGS